MQVAYDEAIFGLCEHHLTMTTHAAMVTTTVSLTWYMTTKDAIGTGINPFRFGDTDLEAAQQRQARIDLILSGSVNPTLADAQKTLEGKLALPTVDGLNRNSRRLQIWALTWLPSNHPIQRYLREHFMDMESFKLE